MNFLQREVEKYCTQNLKKQDEVLHQLERSTHLKALSPQMIAGPLQGQLLEMLSRLLAPRRILEIGTYTGYSTICLAKGLAPDGMITSIDINPEYRYLVEEAIAKTDLQQRIELVTGDALEIIPQLQAVFDLVYIDAQKTDNDAYFDLVLAKVRAGGAILIDNVLWGGKTLREEKDPETALIHAFNTRIKMDENTHHMIMPIRDGLMMVIKK